LKKYKAYESTRWEDRLDSAIRAVAPEWHHRRVVARERTHYFRYLASLSNTGRRNTSAIEVGETMRGSREKIQVMLNAIQMVDNSGLCSSLLWKFMMYICGTLRWQSLCGDKATATQYEDYVKAMTGRGLDLTNRFSLRQMCMLDIKGIALKGDIGTNIVRQSKDIYLQGIEAERIGDPYTYTVTNSYVRGLRIDPSGIIMAADIFYRDRTSARFIFDQTIPMRDERGFPRFLFLVNPISYDDYRGVSMFKSAIDNATYIDNMRQQELQALMWAASQSGVYHTNSGTLPEQLPFDKPTLTDDSGNNVNTYQVRPNTIQALGVGENVEMFQHDRPSPNVLGMVKDTIRDICVGFGVSFEFGWDQSGLTGPAVRSVSSQDARAFEVWQELLKEAKLDPAIGLILGNGIANGDIPYHANWQKWRWQFPAKSTIDAGRESTSNIEEIAAGINTGARVASDDGLNINEIHEQLGLETETKIQKAMEVADALTKEAKEPINWREVYNYMFPPRMQGAIGAGASPATAGGLPVGGGAKDTKGVTTDGVAIDGKGGTPGGNGHKMRGDRVWIDGQWYAVDQARDDHGRFEDEGAIKGKLTGLDKRILDLKKNRPLTKGVRSITRYVPGVQYVPYSKTPFFSQLNEKQGTPDPEKISAKEYVDARAKLFDGVPKSHILIKNLIVTQPVVNGAKVADIKEADSHAHKAINAVKYGGKVYVLDGHHHLAAAAARGETEVKARVLSLKTKMSIDRVWIDGKWYAPDQARDDHGRFEDEGKARLPSANNPDRVLGGTSAEGADAILSAQDDKGTYHGITTKSGTQFFSPNTSDMNFDDAVKAMNDPGQEQARTISQHIDGAVGIEHSVSQNGIGDWSDGAENSVVSEVGGFDDFDQLRYSAALKGKALNQKAVLAFQVGDGKDAIYNTIIPSNDLNEIREVLDKAGIQHRTLLPEGDNTRIVVYSQGDTQEKNFSKVAEHYDSIISKQRGTGEFVGEAETREGAAKNYDAIVKDYEQKFPDRGHYGQTQGQGIHDNGSAVTSLADVKPPTGDADMGRYVRELNSSSEYQAINSKLSELQTETKNGDIENWSIEKNSDASGNLTPERQALHDKIINGSLNPKAVASPGTKPIMNLLMGVPGSGKTTVGLKFIKGENTYISPDTLREQLPEYNGWNTPATQNEAKQLTNRLFPEAMAARHNITTDITGTNSAIPLVNAAGEAGYDVHVIQVKIPVGMSVQRSVSRFSKGGKNTGRFTPPDYITEHVDSKPDVTYDKLKTNQYVKTWKRVDNSGKSPIVVDEGNK
jgi:capsid protein/predicted ABC-type ATPase